MPHPFDRYRRLATGLAGVSTDAVERVLRVIVKESDVAADRVEQVVNEVLAASGRGSSALADAVRTEAELLLRRVDPDARLDLEYLEQLLVAVARALLVDDASPPRDPQAGGDLDPERPATGNPTTDGRSDRE